VGIVRKKIKQVIFNVLQPYGFSVDGIKPAGYISKDDLNYKSKGFNDLRSYFADKWQSDVQQRCIYYVDRFFKNRLLGKEKVVEIGTGVGFVTKNILEYFPNLEFYSFELDNYLSKYLKEDFKNHNFKSVNSNGKDLTGISDKSIDVAIAFGVFTYINFSNIVKYLDEIDRVTKKGSLLFFDIFDIDSNSDVTVSCFEYYGKNGENRPFLSGKLLEKLLLKKNFKMVDNFQEDFENSNKFLYEKFA